MRVHTVFFSAAIALNLCPIGDIQTTCTKLQLQISTQIHTTAEYIFADANISLDRKKRADRNGSLEVWMTMLCADFSHVNVGIQRQSDFCALEDGVHHGV